MKTSICCMVHSDASKEEVVCELSTSHCQTKLHHDIDDQNDDYLDDNADGNEDKTKERRAKELEMEMVWESSQDLGVEADLFTGLMHGDV